MSVSDEIAETIDVLVATLARHPERRMDLVEEAVLRGEPRSYPVLYLGRGADTEAGEVLRRCPVLPQQSPEERLLCQLRWMTRPLAMHNPIRPRIGLGKGTGTLAASFGIYLDPELDFTPTGYRTMAEILAEGMPDPETSGILPELREDIDAAQRLTPDVFEIAPPDMQGPFNLAHIILGTEALYAPYEEPEMFAAVMTIITDFFIAVAQNLRRWIAPERFPRFPIACSRIAECSVNLVSATMYEEHILPHDRRIAEYYGQTAIHPCSGPHVFYATTRQLPNVVYQEAGYIAKAAAGAISVDDALAEIGERAIILAIGQELPVGEEEACIRHDLDRAITNPRLLFSYTGMHWSRRDEPMIREMHRRLDEYWAEQIVPRATVVSG